MSRSFFVAALAAMLLPVVAFATDAPAKATHFGAPITLKASVNIAALAASPQKFNGHTVRLEGAVQDVDPGKGSWLEVTDGKGASFTARCASESMRFPADCKGWRVVIQGRLGEMPTMPDWVRTPGNRTRAKREYAVVAAGMDFMPAAAPAR